MTTMRLGMAMILVVAAAADARAESRGGAALHHVPPAEADPDQPLELVALIDDAWTESLVVRYRGPGAQAFAEVPFELSTTGEHVATIPADAVDEPGVDYYIAAVGGGEATPRFASPEWPHRVRVEPPASERWIDVEKRRLAGRRSRVRSTLTGQSFGRQSDAEDYYLRGEVDLTHRLVTRLYSFSVGFGFLHGATPRDEGAGPVQVERRARYGYGGLRLRLHDGVWLDGRALMGFDRSGFIGGGGGTLTLGDYWRSCVQLGFEYAGGLGPSAWVRLQWDTVPPLLMGATLVKTDLPDAERSDGSALVYDLSYAVTRQLRLVGAVSFGARGRRPGGVGGTLGASYGF